VKAIGLTGLAGLTRFWERILVGGRTRLDSLATQASVLARPRHKDYKPTYRESSYHRPIYSRLTPLARFTLGVAAVCLGGLFIVLINKALASREVPDKLSDRPGFQMTRTPTPLAFQLVIYATPVDATSVPTETPDPSTATPAPTATPYRAPWASHLSKKPDGTLTAPKEVVNKALADLGSYYAMQRDLSLDDYMARRQDILNTYFTGAALAEQQKIEETRDLYAMNRSGRFTVEIRNFEPDGLTAKAGVIMREWVSDVYDVASGQLVAQGRTKKDALTIMRIAYDQTSERWKFAAVEEVIELNQ
jgi:hypothetical protein